jgi:uncharacterized protein
MEEIRGFSLPFRIDHRTGGVAQESGEEKIKENLIHILLTGIGERVMLREYGGGIRQLLHDPNNAALQAIVQRQVARSISRWEPRVLLRKIDLIQEDATLIIRLDYVIRQTLQAQNLKVPLGWGGVS